MIDYVWLTFWNVVTVVVALKVWAESITAARRRRANTLAEQRANTLAEHQRQAARERALIDLALTCRRCRSLASPIPGTGNRYKCGRCDNQFAAARHGLL